MAGQGPASGSAPGQEGRDRVATWLRRAASNSSRSVVFCCGGRRGSRVSSLLKPAAEVPKARRASSIVRRPQCGGLVRKARADRGRSRRAGVTRPLSRHQTPPEGPVAALPNPKGPRKLSASPVTLARTPATTVSRMARRCRCPVSRRSAMAVRSGASKSARAGKTPLCPRDSPMARSLAAKAAAAAGPRRKPPPQSCLAPDDRGWRT